MFFSELSQPTVIYVPNQCFRYTDISRILVYYSFSTGLFIFLSFAASGKALELYKSKLAGIQRSRATQNEVNAQRNYNCNQTDGNQVVQDTRL